MVEAALWSAIALVAAFSTGTLFLLVSRLDGLSSRIDSGLDGLSARVDGLTARGDGLSARLDAQAMSFDSRLDALTARMDDRFDRVDDRLAGSSNGSIPTSAATPAEPRQGREPAAPSP